MTQRFEFSLHVIRRDDAQIGSVDATLALAGAQGWEVRGITTLANGDVAVALQRNPADDAPLPDAPALTAALAEPLTMPTPEDLAIEGPG